MLKVSLWKLKALGWIGVLFFSFCMVGSFLDDQRMVSPFFIPFILLSIPVLLQAGRIEATDDILRLYIPLGQFEISWDDVKRIEVGQSFIIFHTDRGHLNIPLASWWSGSDKSSLSDMIKKISDERAFPVSKTFFGDFKLPSKTLKKS